MSDSMLLNVVLFLPLAGITLLVLVPARAEGTMRWVTLGTTDLLECDNCDGTWLEASGFERLCADRERQAGMLEHSPTDNTPAGVRRQPPESIHYRPCPRCGKCQPVAG